MRLIHIEDASIEDSLDIWKWRNDEQTRLMSKDQEYISWEIHTGWYKKLLNDKKRTLYIGRLDGNSEKIGICRFDAKDNLAEVSINLNPKMRGLDLSYPFLGSSIKKFTAKSKTNLLATIRIDNLASIKCFERCGFNLMGHDGDFQSFILVSPN